MILSCHSFTDSRIHQSREGGQHVDRWIHLTIMQLPVDVDLSLCNVTSQIGNRVSDVVVGHSEDGDLGDGPSSALNPTGPLVDGGQIRVHVTGETTPSGNLFPSG